MDRQLAAAIITCLLLTVCIMSLQFCHVNTQADETSCLLKVQTLTLMQTLYMITIHYVLEVWSLLGSLCSFPSLCWQATSSSAVANPSQDMLKRTKPRRLLERATMLSTVMCVRI